MAWAPPSKPGDRDPAIAAAKAKLAAYSYGKGLDRSDTYTVEFAVALIEYQTRRNLQILKGQVTGMPGMNTQGILDWATKKNLGVLPEQLVPQPVTKPVVFTIAGHLGGLFDGPAYFTARDLEVKGRVRVQPIGYDNVAKPFNIVSGIAELERQVNMLPPGTPYAVLAHSEGSIVFCDWWERNPHRPGFVGGINFGNPRRPRGVAAPWITDPPPPDTEGLDPVCLRAPIPGVAEASRDGDMYATKRPGRAADYMSAVYQAVARGQFTGRHSLAEQIGVLASRFGAVEVLAVYQAIASGVKGVINLREHNEFDLRPCIEYTARILGV
jgi:hypothetical protein